jgi:hypothetical protein
MTFLCGHRGASRVKSDINICGTCHSFWDLRSLNIKVPHPESYSAARFHYDAGTGHDKIRSFQLWAKRLELKLGNRVVCEVGFGGAWILEKCRAQARSVYGIESIQANVTAAVQKGIDRTKLFLAGELPLVFPEKIDLWIFLDSFEHLTDPSSFLSWAVGNSVRPQLLIVAPRADSLSQTIMGRLWPHRLPDHPFHWSKAGLVEFLDRRGFKLQSSFNPVKYVSLATILAHLAHKFGWRFLISLANRLPINPTLRFNIGEMGLLFSSNEP